MLHAFLYLVLPPLLTVHVKALWAHRVDVELYSYYHKVLTVQFMCSYMYALVYNHSLANSKAQLTCAIKR